MTDLDKTEMRVREAEEECSRVYSIRAGQSESLPCWPFVYSKKLVFKDKTGKTKAELRPIMIKLAGRGPGIAAFELVFGNGIKVLLDYPVDFSSRHFRVSSEEEYYLINEAYLKACLAGVDPDIVFSLSDDGLNVANPSDEDEFCSFSSLGDQAIERGLAGYYWKNPVGGDAEYTGASVDGDSFYAVTRGKLGKCHKCNWNEDSVGIGFATGRFIVADGLGGGPYGECAAAFIVEAVLQSRQVSLVEVLREAHYRFYIYNRYLYLRGLQGGDAVLTSVQIDGDKFEAVSFGDARFMQVRDGKIRERSKVQSFVGKAVDEGQMTEVQAMRSLRRNIVYNSVKFVPFAPDVRTGTLKKGDILWLFSDGLALSPQEIIERSAKNVFVSKVEGEAVMRLTAERNKQGVFLFKSQDESLEEVQSPKDNGTLILIRRGS